MIDHEAAMLAYVGLAVVSQKRRQLLGRDKLLVLAAAAACRAGWPDVAEQCRLSIVQHNPSHVLHRYSTVAEALRGEELPPLIKQLERRLPYERAEFLLNRLEPLPTNSPADDSQTPASSAGTIALSLLDRLNSNG